MATDDCLLARAEEDGVDRGIALEPAGDLLDAGAGAREAVDLSDTIRGGDEELGVVTRAA